MAQQLYRVVSVRMIGSERVEMPIPKYEWTTEKIAKQQLKDLKLNYQSDWYSIQRKDKK